MSERVLGIVYTHENAVLCKATEHYCYEFNRAGFEADVVDLSLPRGMSLLVDRLMSGDVSFCFGLQGVGSRLEYQGDNLWTKLKIPFLCLHFDNPCYNPFNHYSVSSYVANLYNFKSFLDIQKRFIGGHQVSALLPFEVLKTPVEPHFAFHDRPYRMLFLKMGGSVKEFVDYFGSLPEKINKGIYEILEKLKLNPNLIICELVDELFLRSGYDRKVSEKDFWAVVQSIDFYLRRQRAIDMVNWLKYQEHAVIVGDGWDEIDRTNAKAEFRPAVDFQDAFWLYNQTQFIINTNPYGSDIIHERIVLGLLFRSCVITDTNQWLDDNLGQVAALKRFKWTEPLDEQLLPFMKDLGSAEAAAYKARDVAIEKFASNKSIALMIDWAQRVKVINLSAGSINSIK